MNLVSNPLHFVARNFSAIVKFFKYRKAFALPHGYSMLEQVLLLPILLSLIVAGLDVTRIIQSHTALQEGVRTSLRCVYTVDGKCVSTSPDLRTRYFNVFEIPTESEYLSQMMDYRGRGSWLELPFYTYNNIRATVLGTVNYQDRSRESFDAKRVAYPATFSPSGPLRTARFPYITGTDSRNAEFNYKEAEGTPYKRVQSVNIDSLLLGPNNRKETISFTISLPQGLNSASPCFESQSLDKVTPSHQIKASSHCATDNRATGPFKDDLVVLHIKGKSTGSGRVGLRLLHNYNLNTDASGNDIYYDAPHDRNKDGEINERDSVEDRDLGGQRFDGLDEGRYNAQSNTGTSRNFSPRGAPSAYVDEGFWRNHSEYAHHQYILLRYGVEAKIEFDWKSHGDNPENSEGWWHGTVMNVYLPEYINYDESFKCQNKIPKGAYEKGDISCVLSDQDKNRFPLPPKDQIVVDTKVNVDNSPKAGLGCFSSYNEMKDALSKMSSSELKELGLNDRELANYVFTSSPGNCASEYIPKNCPENNSGVLSSEVGSDGKIKNSSTASTICAAPSEADPDSIYWTQKPITVAESGEFTWTVSNCTATNHTAAGVPLPPEIAQFKQLTFGEIERNVSLEALPLYTGRETSPEEFIKEKTEYNCPGVINTKQVIFDGRGDANTYPPGTLVQYVERGSILSGARPQFLESCDPMRLRNGATGLDQNAFFEGLEPLYVGESAPYAEPPDDCTVFKVSEKRSGAPTALGVFAEGALPERCFAEGVKCVTQFSHFEGENSGATTYDFERAVSEWGFREIQAALPKAKFGCSGPYCVTLNVQEDAEALSSSGSISIPLMYPLKLVLGDTFTVTSRASETAEYNFVK